MEFVEKLGEISRIRSVFKKSISSFGNIVGNTSERFSAYFHYRSPSIKRKNWVLKNNNL